MLDVTFEYYETEYYGDTLTDANFPKYRSRAWSEVNYFTGNRAEEVDESTSDSSLVSALKNCICEVADACRNSESSDGKVVLSERVGSRSVTYSSKSADISINKVIKGIVRKYLAVYGYTVAIVL